MVKLPYGEQGIKIPDILNTSNCNCEYANLPLKTLEPISNKTLERDNIRKALSLPIGYIPLKKWIEQGDTVAIIIPDITRKCPVKMLLENLLPEVIKASPHKIEIVVATGNHRGLTKTEIEFIVGKDIAKNYTISNHDSIGDCKLIGKTSYDNSIYINKKIMEASKVIMFGSVNFHPFAGFSGGRKSLLPGVASKETILVNHKLMVGEKDLIEEANVGILDGNPVNEDMQEAMELFGLEKIFLLNVVTNARNEILYAYAGHPIKVFKKATEKVRELYSIKLGRRYDIVIACAGGSPSDTNFYQATKALELTMNAVKPGADFFLVAECKDGIGCELNLYKKWFSLRGEEFISMFHNEYHNLGTGPYKVDLMLNNDCSLYMVSDCLNDMKNFFRMEQVVSEDFEHKLSACIGKYNESGITPDILVIPYGSFCALLK